MRTEAQKLLALIKDNLKKGERLNVVPPIQVERGILAKIIRINPPFASNRNVLATVYFVDDNEESVIDYKEIDDELATMLINRVQWQ